MVVGTGDRLAVRVRRWDEEGLEVGLPVGSVGDSGRDALRVPDGAVRLPLPLPVVAETVWEGEPEPESEGLGVGVGGVAVGAGVSEREGVADGGLAVPLRHAVPDAVRLLLPEPERLAEALAVPEPLGLASAVDVWDWETVAVAVRVLGVQLAVPLLWDRETLPETDGPVLVAVAVGAKLQVCVTLPGEPLREGGLQEGVAVPEVPVAEGEPEADAVMEAEAVRVGASVGVGVALRLQERVGAAVGVGVGERDREGDPVSDAVGAVAVRERVESVQLAEAVEREGVLPLAVWVGLAGLRVRVAVGGLGVRLRVREGEAEAVSVEEAVTLGEAVVAECEPEREGEGESREVTERDVVGPLGVQEETLGRLNVFSSENEYEAEGVSDRSRVAVAVAVGVRGLRVGDVERVALAEGDAGEAVPLAVRLRLHEAVEAVAERRVGVGLRLWERVWVRVRDGCEGL